MTTPDAFYLALIAIGLCIDSFVLWPIFLPRLQAQSAQARLQMWGSSIILLWTLAAGTVVLWIIERRNWRELRLVIPHAWQLLGIVGLLFAVAVVYARPIAKIVRRDRSKRIRVSNAVKQRAPHTRGELAVFLGLALSAGVCEELVFRGYLIWVLQPHLGVWGAAALSLVIFAAAHVYQGAKGVLAVAFVGGVFTLVVLVFGSLIPAMLIHAFADAGEGLVGWLALREVPSSSGDNNALIGAPQVADQQLP